MIVELIMSINYAAKVLEQPKLCYTTLEEQFFLLIHDKMLFTKCYPPYYYFFFLFIKFKNEIF